MNDHNDTCITGVELAIALDEGMTDAQQAHVRGCAACTDELAEMDELRGLAAELPFTPLSADRLEAVHASLLEAVEAEPEEAEAEGADRPERVGPGKWSYALTAFAAAAVTLLVSGAALAIWAPGEGEPPAEDTMVKRGHVLEHPGAEYLHLEDSPDEIVRLIEGKLTVRVDPLQQGERFRVVTGDAEVEVVGTAFDVEARDDKLVSVRVLHGKVEVRKGDAPPVMLTIDQSWATPTVVAARVDDAAANDAPPKPAGGDALESPVEPAPVEVPGVVRDIALAELAPSSADVTKPRSASTRQRRAARRVRPRADHGGKAPRISEPVSAVDNAPGPIVEPPEAPSNDAAPPGISESERAFEQGWGELQAGRFAAAADSFEVASESPSARLAEDGAFWHAVALMRSGRRLQGRRSLRAFLASHAGSPRVGSAATMLGWELAREGQRSEALRLFERGVKDKDPRVRDSAQKGLDALEAQTSPKP